MTHSGDGVQWSPALKLPYELTSQIFMDCLPVDGRARPSLMAAPLLLAQICVVWRSVALSLPQLWSSVFLEFSRPGRTSKLANNSIALVDCWFGRSGQHPLSITIMCGPQAGLPLSMLQVLGARSSQWARLELRISRHDFLALDERLLDGPFPLLQTLAIDVPNTLPDLVWRHAPCVFAPNLTVLRLGDTFRGSFLSGSDALSPSLEALEFSPSDRSSLDSCSRVVSLFPQLVHCTLHMGSHRPRADAHLWNPPLRSLILPNGAAKFLSMMAIPTLQILHTSLFTLAHCRALESFLSRSAVSLSELTLQVIFTVPDIIGPSIEPAVNLVVLRLTLMGRSTMLYESLQRPDFLPRLQILQITFHTSPLGEGLHYNALLDILRARRSVRLAELKLLPRSEGEPVVPPTDAVIAAFAALCTPRVQGRISTPTQSYRWPADSTVLHSLDDTAAQNYDIFIPTQPLPEFFPSIQRR